jgi:hypothetical protein
MAKALPAVQARFAEETLKSLHVIGATEALWLTAPPTSEVRKQLKVGQLEALYESGYLRIYAAWENVLESLVVYYLAGYCSANYRPVYVARQPGPTLGEARAALYAGKSYLLWHDPRTVANRVRAQLTACPVESVMTRARSELENYSAVRHAIAHASVDAQAKFKAASHDICGYTHPRVGRFLRSEDLRDPLNPMKRVLAIRNRLVELVGHMAA